MLRITASLVLLPCILFAQDDPTSSLPTTTPLCASSASGGDTLWAAGAAYKVAFGDRFTFFPYVPAQTTTRGFTWRTESLRTGDGERTLDSGWRANDARQCRFEHAGLTEIYDLRDGGVEQSFVVAEAPHQPGPIVITGSLTTPFVAAPRAAAVGALTFATPEGEAAMTYGTASVRDAAGHVAPVTTSFDGERIVLAVAAEFVAAAAFPITIDPLTAPVAVSTGTSVTHTAIAATSTTGNHATLVAFVREFSTTDHDVYAYTVPDNGSAAPALAFIDLSTVDMLHVAAADVGATQTWVLAVERTPTSGQTIALYRQSQANPTTLGWASTLVPGSPNSNPALGGTAVAGNLALLVYEHNPGFFTYAFGALFNTTTGALSPAFSLQGASGGGVCRQPTVTHSALGAEPWRVAWSEDSGNSVDFLIRTNVVDQAGTAGTARTHVTATNAREPRIDGSIGRYVMTWLDSPSSSSMQLHSRRFDYATNGAVTNIHDRVLATAALVPAQSLGQGGIAFDVITTSHWAVTWRTSLFLGTSLSTTVQIARLGYTGGVVDATPLSTSNADGVAFPVVAFDGYPQVGEAEGFVAAYAANNVNGTANFRRYSYTPPTGAVYGTSCRSNTMGDGHPPYAGSEFYRMFVAGLQPGTPALYLFGTSPANVQLDPIGMTGCSLLVNYVVALGTIADGAGLAQMTIALPDDPAYFGDFYFQWAWFEPAANPFGFVTGRGGHIQVQ
jgi:hypothetical protein